MPDFLKAPCRFDGLIVDLKALHAHLQTSYLVMNLPPDSRRYLWQASSNF